MELKMEMEPNMMKMEIFCSKEFSKMEKKRNGVIEENGKEYFVEYDEKEMEIMEKRVRTFEGVRIMVIGNQDVGKTSFKTRLIGSSDEKKNEENHKKVLNEKKEYEMTHGVDIFNWKSKDDKTLFSIWDFAGHEEYHIAHSFFFSEGCVYLLLFDCSFELDELISKNKLIYWIHFLQTQIGEKASFIFDWN